MLYAAVLVIYPAVVLFQSSNGEARRAWLTLRACAIALALFLAFGLLLGKPSPADLVGALSYWAAGTLPLLAVTAVVVLLAGRASPLWVQALAGYTTMAISTAAAVLGWLGVCMGLYGSGCAMP